MLSEESGRIERLLEAISRALAEDFNPSIEPSEQPDRLQPLEAAISVLIAEFAETKRRNREQILEIRAQNREMALRQAQALRELAIPIIVVWDGILTLPLIGTIDVERGQALLETVLSRVVEERAQYVIIDLVGIRKLDIVTAQYLVRTTRAVRLLGGTCFLTGMSPALASTLLQLDPDLGEVRTMRRLSEALKIAFSELNLRVVLASRREPSHE